MNSPEVDRRGYSNYGKESRNYNDRGRERSQFEKSKSMQVDTRAYSNKDKESRNYQGRGPKSSQFQNSKSPEVDTRGYSNYGQDSRKFQGHSIGHAKSNHNSYDNDRYMQQENKQRMIPSTTRRGFGNRGNRNRPCDNRDSYHNRHYKNDEGHCNQNDNDNRNHSYHNKSNLIIIISLITIKIHVRFLT